MLMPDALYYLPCSPKFTHKRHKVPLAQSQIGTAQFFTNRPFAFGVASPRKKRLFLFAGDSEQSTIHWLQTILQVQKALESDGPTDGLSTLTTKERIAAFGPQRMRPLIPKSGPPLPVNPDAISVDAGGHSKAPEPTPRIGPRSDEPRPVARRTGAPCQAADPVVHKKLAQATKHGRYEEVEAALKTGYPANAVDEHGDTLLHVAAFNGHLRLIRLCLRFGGNSDIRNAQGLQPLHGTVRYGYRDAAEYLVSKGAKLSPDGEGQSVGQQAPANLYQAQDEALRTMGFVDRARNVEVLLHCQGDVGRAAMRIAKETGE